jgi:hypothetical protein
MLTRISPRSIRATVASKSGKSADKFSMNLRLRNHPAGQQEVEVAALVGLADMG